MENSYSRYLELQEEAKDLEELNNKLNTAVAEAKDLVSKLDTKFEYIRSYVAQLEGNVNDIYGVQVAISDLSSKIALLSVQEDGVYLEDPQGQSQFLTHEEYKQFKSNRKKNGFE